nr:DUF5447 family protein [Pseudomonas citronellolis]
MTPAIYARPLHPVDCNCSVCWSRREVTKPAPSLFTRCTECRRTKVFSIVTTMASV